MFRLRAAVVCGLAVFTSSAFAQKPSIEPVHIAAGSVLTFHLQTRLHATGDALDTLPQGTILEVRIFEAIHSDVTHDGAEFHGSIVSAVVSGNQVIVHPDSEVRGVFALLRSRNHPEGFRYELLLTSVTDHGKSMSVTASLNSSFSDVPASTATRPVEQRENSRQAEPVAVQTHP